MTRAEREEAARKLVCPRCHAEAGRKCQQRRGMMSVVTSSPMKGIHEERLELVKDDNES